MPWVTLDDRYPDHPKLMAVGPFGLALQTAAICYCARYLTDGYLPGAAAHALVRAVMGATVTLQDGTLWTPSLTSGHDGRDAGAFDWPAIMVQAKLWEVRNGGYVVHDYLTYNLRKSEIERRRKQAANRVDRWRSGNASVTHNVTRSKRRGNAAPQPQPQPQPREEKKESTGTRQFQIGDLVPALWTQVNQALDACRRLGAVPKLREMAYWSALLEAYGDIDAIAELKRAEAWLAANPTRAPQKDLARFLMNWCARAAKERG